MKNIVKLNESQIKKIVAESVKKVLREWGNEPMDTDYVDLRKELMSLGKICVRAGGSFKEIDRSLGEKYGVDEDAVDELLTEVNRIKNAKRFEEILDFDNKVVFRIDALNIVYISMWCYIEEAPDKLFPCDEVELWDSDIRRKAKRVVCVFSRNKILQYLNDVD